MKVLKKIVCGCLLIGLLLNGISHAYSVSYAAEEVERKHSTQNMQMTEELSELVTENALNNEAIEIQPDLSSSEDEQVQDESTPSEGDQVLDDTTSSEGEQVPDDTTSSEGEQVPDDNTSSEGEQVPDDNTSSEGGQVPDDNTSSEGNQVPDDNTSSEGDQVLDDTTSPDEGEGQQDNISPEENEQDVEELDKENTDVEHDEDLDDENLSTDLDSILPDEEDLLLENDDLVEQDIEVEDYSDSIIRNSSDTLLSLSGYGSYEGATFLQYLLTDYNVVSLDEIHSTHIVGPIISQNVAERTFENFLYPTGSLVAADYSRGVPSYIGEFSSYNSGADIGVRLNYAFDTIEDSQFRPPFLYSDESNLRIRPLGDDKFILTENGTDGLPVMNEVESANNWGQTLTYQNNNFIDFNALTAAMERASDYVFDNGNAEHYHETVRYEYSNPDRTRTGAIITVIEQGEEPIVITATNGVTLEDGRGYKDFVKDSTIVTWPPTGIRLQVRLEESWTIKDSDDLQEVDIQLPDDYDYYSNPYFGPTTINFADEYINPAIYDIDVNGDGIKEKVKHSRMPYTLINGSQFIEQGGANGEYGEVGNKIIWNMPNVVTNSETGDNRLTVFHSAHNTAGHIVAPGAEFWNYNQYGQWEGGNLNGAAIVKNFQSGRIEVHMWPYNGREEKAVQYSVETLKKVNGGKTDKEYLFLLDVINPGTIPEGVVNTKFPLKATSDLDTGKVIFEHLAFDQEGTYEFTLKEDIPDTPVDNMDYDQTVYKIVITVDSETKEGLTGSLKQYFISSVVTYKITNRDGVSITPEVVTGEHGSVFDNRTDNADKLNLMLIKTNQRNELLKDVGFRVQEVVRNENNHPVVVENGYDETYTSDENGQFEIIDLEPNRIYMVTEITVPYDHEKFTGYWLIDVLEDKTYTINEYDENHQLVRDVVDHKLYNRRYEVVLPNTGGIGTYIFYIIGFACIAVCIIYCVSKLIVTKEKTTKKKTKARKKR